MSDIKKFVIIGYPRTKSTHLVRLLNQHPEISCEPEIFWEGYLDRKKYQELSLLEKKDKPSFSLEDLIELRVKEPVKFVELVYKVIGYEKQVVGFKLFPHHNIAAFHYIINNKEIAKISLVRNFLFTYVSVLQGRKTDQWNLKDKKRGITSPKVEFNKEEFSQYVNNKVAELKYMYWELKRTGQEFFLCFADDIGKEKWWKDIYGFLGISNMIQTESDMIKQNPNYLEERVANYQEMIQQLNNTQYAQLLYGDFFPNRQSFLEDFIIGDQDNNGYYYEVNPLIVKENTRLRNMISKRDKEITELQDKLSHVQDSKSPGRSPEVNEKSLGRSQNTPQQIRRRISTIESSLSYKLGYFLTRFPAAILYLFKSRNN
jgi:hypothetical protein